MGVSPCKLSKRASFQTRQKIQQTVFQTGNRRDRFDRIPGASRIASCRVAPTGPPTDARNGRTAPQRVSRFDASQRHRAASSVQQTACETVKACGGGPPSARRRKPRIIGRLAKRRACSRRNDCPRDGPGSPDLCPRMQERLAHHGIECFHASERINSKASSDSMAPCMRVEVNARRRQPPP